MIALPMVPDIRIVLNTIGYLLIALIQERTRAAGRDETYRPFSELASKFKGVDRKEV